MLDKTKKNNFYPKGRNIDESAVTEVKNLIGKLPVQRDLLIEYLHLIQDKHKQIRKKYLAALSYVLKIPFAEVYEVASFYAHFDVIEDDTPSLQDVTIRVCDSITCEMFGSEKLINDLSSGLDNSKVRVLRAPCMGLCDKAPACEVGHRHVTNASLDSVKNIIDKKELHPQAVSGKSIEEYMMEGGYEILQKCYNGKMDIEKVIEEMNLSGLTGMGGT